jgi:hypothetical protein
MKRLLPFLVVVVVACLFGATFASVRFSPALREQLARRGITVPATAEPAAPATE